MKKSGVLILGSKGMLGSMVKAVFEQNGLEFDELNHEDFDARACDMFELGMDKYEWIVNCIGRIKPTIDENDPKSVWGTILVNAEFPYRLNELGAKVIQIATDCVYSGEQGRYAEDDPADAFDVYGKSKSLGEVKSDNFFNIRCSIIGPGGENGSLFEWFMSQKKGAQVNGFTNHIWNGVTTLHFAKVCLGIIKNEQKITNLQHLVPADTVTKAQLLHMMASVWDRIDIKITDTKAPARADRSLDTDDPVMNGVYWLLAGYKQPPTILQMLEELKEFMDKQ